MKYLIAVLLLAAGFMVIVGQGTHFDLLHQHTPVYQQRSYGIGPVSYSEPVCVENCENAPH